MSELAQQFAPEQTFIQRLRENVGMRLAGSALAAATAIGAGELVSAEPVGAEVPTAATLPQSGPTYSECKTEALTFPSDIALKYVKVNNYVRRYINTKANLPDLNACANFGTRIFRLQKVVEQSWVNGKKVEQHTMTDGTVRMAYGDGARSVNKTINTTEFLSCYKTPSTSDGVKYARAYYQMRWIPANTSRSSAIATKSVRPGNIQYC